MRRLSTFYALPLLSTIVFALPAFAQMTSSGVAFAPRW
jgi:hypothetical protein